MTREEFRAILVGRDAYTVGLEDYDAASDDAVAPFLNWSLASQLAAIRGPLRQHVGWLWRAGVLPMWSMREANLSGSNLRGASLAGANLAGADLQGADLTRADLYRADLYGARCPRINLTLADLYGANLAGADLQGAALVCASLRYASVVRANLSGAQMDRTIMPAGWESDVAFRPDGARGWLP